ncbi:hypothetical protein Tco_0467720, partial [Tanacetum coccineum]
MGTPTQVCVWSCPNFSAPAGRPFRCVKSKVCDWYWKRKDVTQGDWVEMDVGATVSRGLGEMYSAMAGNLVLRLTGYRAQSSRVPVPLPGDPNKAIRQAYLDGTDTESEPFEDPMDTETPESPLAIAPPVPLSESTPPILVPILRKTARMAMRVLHVMSLGLSASLAEVAAMSESALHKRYRSSCESSPSVSPPDLPLRKRYHGMSELVEDSEDEDEEIGESMDS